MIFIIIIIIIITIILINNNSEIMFKNNEEFNNNSGIVFNNNSGIVFKNNEDSNKFIFFTDNLHIYQYIENNNNNFKLRKDISNILMPQYNTLNLRKNMDNIIIIKNKNTELTIEIILCLLNNPKLIIYESFDNFKEELNIRQNIVKYGYQTHVEFSSSNVKRPLDYFYSVNDNILLLENKSLINGIIKSIIPDDKLYTFTCYRITENIVLLAILLEAKNKLPELVDKIETIYRKKSIKSKQFHTIFMRESLELMPSRYYTPGDRVWFKNPDEKSSTINGYEGKWTIYLNNGLFCDFWKDGHSINHHFTIEEILIEIYNWRYSIDNNEIDEDTVHNLNINIKNNVNLMNTIIHDMSRYNNNGGAIDRTREYPQLLSTILGNLKTLDTI